MELSQGALAMLLFAGVPAGMIFNIAYALTDVGVLRDGFVKKVLVNAKDCLFMIFAGLAAILMVYYINAGQYRYLVLLGMLTGYAVSHATVGKGVILARNALLRHLAIPVTWIWNKTLGLLCAKARNRALKKATNARANELMRIASQGFEN